jgi:hypothetical protein
VVLFLALPGSAGTARLCRLLFSNRPFGVKRFQTIHHYSVDVAHGLVLLFGIGTQERNPGLCGPIGLSRLCPMGAGVNYFLIRYAEP